MLKLVLIAVAMTEMVPKERILLISLLWEKLPDSKISKGKTPLHSSSPRNLPDLPSNQVNHQNRHQLNQHLHKQNNHFNDLVSR